MTDSEIVPWGNGEKNSGKGSEIDREIISLQTEEERLNVLPCACWRMFQRVIFCGKVKIVTNIRSHSESELEKSEKSQNIDPNPLDLTISRMKLR